MILPLALKGERGTYHINGNWKIELPGEFDVDGTIVYYQRKGTQETFFAKGPTKEPLHIMVRFCHIRNFRQNFRLSHMIVGDNCSNFSEIGLYFKFVSGNCITSLPPLHSPQNSQNQSLQSKIRKTGEGGQLKGSLPV